jgi:hypothetical protein
MNISTDTKISLAATIIALCALGVSLWEGYNVRHHNQLSVKPYMVLSFDYDENGVGSVLSG